MAGTWHPGAPGVAAGQHRSRCVHRRRGLYRPVDRLLPQPRRPRAQDHRARGQLRRVRRLGPERRLGDGRAARVAGALRQASAGTDGVRDLEQHLRDTVDEVARVCAAEGIDAGLVKGGTLTVATSAAQEARLRHRLEQDRAWGDDAGTVRYLEKTELDDHLRLTGALGALYSPHCARVQPAAWSPGWPRRSPGAGPALRGHPGDVDLGRAPRTQAATCAHLISCAAPRGTPRTCRPAPDAAADEQLDDHHRPARR